MSSIEDQQKILEEIALIVHQNSDPEYQKSACRFDYDVDEDGSFSVGCEFWYFLNGNEKSAAIRYDDRIKLVGLIPKLHKIMNSHTGGNWRSFTLSIDEKRKVSSKFDYCE